MKDYITAVKAAEEATRDLQNEELRKIAFAEILKRELDEDSGDAVHEREPKKRAPARSTSSSAAKASRPGEPKVRPAVSSLDFGPDEEGMPTWSDIKSDWLKFCWILEVAKNKGVDGLANSEISYLIEKVFRESSAPKLVNNLKLKVKDAIVKSIQIEHGNHKLQGWKILRAGTEYLAKTSKGSEESK